MNREDIIRFGEQADEVADRKIAMRGEYHPDWHMVRDEAFAALVATHVREQCARLYENEFIFDSEEFAALVAAHEREACARVCETEFCGDDVAYYVATAIRARGEK